MLVFSGLSSLWQASGRQIQRLAMAEKKDWWHKDWFMLSGVYAGIIVEVRNIGASVTRDMAMST